MTGTGPGVDGDVAALVQTELERVVRRWQQLPLDRALRAFPQVHRAVQELADETAAAQGLPRAQVPDLGPAVVMDQLRVMVHDWRTAGLPLGAGGPGGGEVEPGLAHRLTRLRRSLP